MKAILLITTLCFGLLSKAYSQTFSKNAIIGSWAAGDTLGNRMVYNFINDSALTIRFEPVGEAAIVKDVKYNARESGKELLQLTIISIDFGITLKTAAFIKPKGPDQFYLQQTEAPAWNDDDEVLVFKKIANSVKPNN